MVNHRSGTWWMNDREVGWRHVQSVPCTKRRGAQVSPGLASKLVATILVVWPENHSLEFLDLGLKTVSRGLVI
jgi:hypothetical protein